MEVIVGIKFASDQGQGCMMIVFGSIQLQSSYQATSYNNIASSGLDLVSFRGQTYIDYHSYRLEEIYRRSRSARFDTTATMASSIYNHHKFARAILKKSRKSEPSLTIELFTDHWKFKNSASIPCDLELRHETDLLGLARSYRIRCSHTMDR